MLGPGDRIPLDVEVWTGPQERVPLARLLEDGPMLLVFYLFDWSAT